MSRWPHRAGLPGRLRIILLIEVPTVKVQFLSPRSTVGLLEHAEPNLRASPMHRSPGPPSNMVMRKYSLIIPYAKCIGPQVFPVWVFFQILECQRRLYHCSSPNLKILNQKLQKSNPLSIRFWTIFDLGSSPPRIMQWKHSNWGLNTYTHPTSPWTGMHYSVHLTAKLLSSSVTSSSSILVTVKKKHYLSYACPVLLVSLNAFWITRLILAYFVTHESISFFS